jgi:hypothetical protein
MKKILCLTAVLLLPPSARAADSVTANDLKQIGLAFHSYHDATNKAPADAKALAPYFENSKKLLGLLENKDIEFVYNVAIRQMTAGASNTALAWEKDVPKKGGLVLFGDGSVRKLTAAAFAKTTRAKAK